MEKLLKEWQHRLFLDDWSIVSRDHFASAAGVEMNSSGAIPS